MLTFDKYPTDGELQKPVFVRTANLKVTEFLQLLSVGILSRLLLWVFWGVGFLLVYCLLVYLGLFPFFFVAFLLPTYTTWIFLYFFHQAYWKCANRLQSFNSMLFSPYPLPNTTADILNTPDMHNSKIIFSPGWKISYSVSIFYYNQSNLSDTVKNTHTWTKKIKKKNYEEGQICSQSFCLIVTN